MIKVLTTIKNELEQMNIPYTFEGWDNEIELPQFVGEISEIPNSNEDGKNEYSFILTGFGISYNELFSFSEQIKSKYKTSYVIDGIVIRYDNTTIIDNGTEDLKQIQINMTIKEWSV